MEVEGYGTFQHEHGPSLLPLEKKDLDLFRDCIGEGGGCTEGEVVGEEYRLVLQQCVPVYQTVFEDWDRIDHGFP